MPGKTDGGPSVTHFSSLGTLEPIAVLRIADLFSIGLGKMTGPQQDSAGQPTGLIPNSRVAEVGYGTKSVSEPLPANNTLGNTAYVILRKSSSSMQDSSMLQECLLIREPITTNCIASEIRQPLLACGERVHTEHKKHNSRLPNT